ncbi:MAG: ROK family protein [Candidatus Dormibacteraeota bacterium]|nr:ROK family protein [Candidatus Dormibacteraeota bacterium]
MASIFAGVDLGGTKIQTAVLKTKRVIGSDRVPTPQTGASDVIAVIASSIAKALEGADVTLAELTAVGVGTPGTIDPSGSVSNSPNVPGFEVGPVALGRELSKALDGVKVLVDNDVRVAVRGEWKRGAGRPFRNFMGVFAGTGVGGGIVINGQLIEGNGGAGEIGHTLVRDRGRLCGCGLKGHMEAYAGRKMIETEARRLQSRGHKTVLFDIMKDRGRDRVTSGVIAAALKQHDKVTTKLIDEAVWALGIALSNVQNLLDLEAIIVGGGLGDRLGKPFVERVASAAQPRLHVPDHPPKFLTTELGDLAGAVGAAVLAGG